MTKLSMFLAATTVAFLGGLTERSLVAAQGNVDAPADQASPAAPGSSEMDDEDPLDSQDQVAFDAAAALNPGSAPGGNFDLSVWELQEPVGSPGSPNTIKPAQLKGASGFHDKFFFTDTSDGSMTFWDPENGVTTPNSNFSRSELREMTSSGAAADWAISGTHTLSATVKITQVPDHVAVGQIHLGTGTPASTKPLLELFYHSNGDIDLAIEQTPAGGNEVSHHVGHVSLGTKWSYVIGLSGNAITLVINSGATQKFTMSSTFNNEHMYFKAGNYDQSSGPSSTVGAKVHFYALKIHHG